MSRTLAAIRLSAGYKTQQSLANAVNSTRSACAKWENGLNYPKATTIVLLSKVLDVPERELIAAIKYKKDMKNSQKEVTP